MKALNEMKLQIESRSVNEGFARATVAAFAAQLDPNIEDISDIKTAVSEAVTNSIVHGYPDSVGKIYIWAGIYENGLFKVKIKDRGLGIEDVKKALEPLFTTLGGERAGLGFAVMESFCDKIHVTSKIGKGTTVTLEKFLKGRNCGDD
ncbi:MAG: anti-sigma F factor [Clostridia bacterium]|nr:anti-sigma F factor [Clostridia bacterium]MBR3819849.1 anti-sigma F factor [Clostridia bacterium]